MRTLSGGNQQKVLLARWLITQPKLLILDEPTRGIDVGAKTEIQRLVMSLCDDGMSVLFISAEIEEVLRLSHKIAVLRDRQVVAELANDDAVTIDAVVQTIAGGAARMSSQRRLIWPLLSIAALLLIDLLFSSGFFSLRMRGRPSLREPDRHPQLRRPVDARRARHDARHRHRRHRPLRRRRGCHLRRDRLLDHQPSRTTRTASAGVLVAVAAALGLSMLCGLWNGTLVAVLGIQPIVATLILMVAGRGIAQLITRARSSRSSARRTG